MRIADSSHSGAVAPQTQKIGFGNNVESGVIALLDKLADLMTLLAPRLDYLLSDSLTPEQRYAFRDLAGPQRIFYLANRIYRLNQSMNALCSEKAREIVAKKREGDLANGHAAEKPAAVSSKKKKIAPTVHEK
jgi:hypothetical protein